MSESPQDRIKRLMRESAPESNVIDLATAARRRGKPLPTPPRAVNIRGDHNTAVAGDGNHVTINVRAPVRPRINVQPGPDAITDAQAAEIQSLVIKVAKVSGQPYQAIWAKLKWKFQFTRYQLLPRAQFEPVRAYLRQKIARAGIAPAHGDAQRKKLLRRLHAEARKNPGTLEAIHAYVAGRFGTQSLAELTAGQLGGVIHEFGL